jgi:hypothetical protein
MKYVIPSFRRADILKNKTLKYLEKHNIKKDDIYIIVRNDDDGYDIFSDYHIVKTDIKGIGRTHNFITEYFNEDEWICEIDDDLTDMIDTENNSIEDFEKVIMNLKEVIIDKDYSYGGFYSTPNPYFMKNIKSEYTFDLRYMLGLIRVRRIRKDIVLETNYSEDFENCIKYYIRDGGIVKQNYIAGKTNNYADGGCNGDGRNLESEKTDKEYLSSKYPKHCQLFQRKNGRWDLRLKDKSDKQSNNNL